VALSCADVEPLDSGCPQAMVRAAKLEVYCIVEVEGQQRRTMPIAGGAGVLS